MPVLLASGNPVADGGGPMVTGGPPWPVAEGLGFALGVWLGPTEGVSVRLEPSAGSVAAPSGPCAVSPAGRISGGPNTAMARPSSMAAMAMTVTTAAWWRAHAIKRSTRGRHGHRHRRHTARPGHR